MFSSLALSVGLYGSAIVTVLLMRGDLQEYRERHNVCEAVPAAVAVPAGVPAAVAALASASCPAGFSGGWSGFCRPVFGVEERLIDASASPCRSVYAHACGLTPAAEMRGPVGFVRLQAANREVMRESLRSGAVREWEASPWRRVLAACRVVRGAGRDPAGEEWLVEGARAIAGARGLGASVGVAMRLGGGPSWVVRPNPANRGQLMLELRVSRAGASAVRGCAACARAWLQGASASESLSLHEYVLSLGDVSLEGDTLNASAVAWVGRLVGELPSAARDAARGGVWATRGVVAAVMALEGPGGAAALVSSVRARLTPTGDCESVAHAASPPRVSRWYAEASVSRSSLAAVRELFEQLRQSARVLVNASSVLSSLPVLRAALQRKLGALELRVEPGGGRAGAEHGGAFSGPPTSLVAELRAAAVPAALSRARDGRWLEPAEATPAAVNAYYNAEDNSVTVFPGLLGGALLSTSGEQSGSGRPGSVRSVELATLGFVLGHEIGHALDSRGIFFDERGSVRVPAVAGETRAYLASMACLIDAYDSRGVDGSGTLDENFADSVAYQLQLAVFETLPAAQAGVARDFYLAQAQLWCGDPSTHGGWHAAHAPSRYRVDIGGQSVRGAIANAFGCPDKYRGQSCKALM
jgi:hypothetical protein